LGNGDGTFGPETAGAVFRSVAYAAMADLNDDGKLDVAVAQDSLRTISVLLGNGDGTFQGPVDFAIGNHVPSYLAVADLNGDSRPDLVATTKDSLVVLFNLWDTILARFEVQPSAPVPLHEPITIRVEPLGAATVGRGSLYFRIAGTAVFTENALQPDTNGW